MTQRPRRYKPSVEHVLWLLSKLQQAAGVALISLFVVGCTMSMFGHSLAVEDKPLVAALGAALGLILPGPSRSRGGRD